MIFLPILLWMKLKAQAVLSLFLNKCWKYGVCDIYGKNIDRYMVIRQIGHKGRMSGHGFSCLERVYLRMNV